MNACAFLGFIFQGTERRKGVHGIAVAVDHLPSAVQEREAVKVILSLDRPASIVIVLKVPAVDQVTVVSAVAVCDLAHIGPVISACAVVIIEPLVKQMMLAPISLRQLNHYRNIQLHMFRLYFFLFRR